MSHNPKTWWGEKFVTALEGFIDSGRLQRGKAYRTDRRVLAFEMKQEKVTAKMLGNANPYFDVYKEPEYKVTIQFEVITQKNWQAIIQRISENPSWLAKLMLKEVPENIESAFEGSYFLPSSYKDIKATCSCPDHANPCKHIAGVYYRIANMLDSDPMLLFELRGLKASDLIKALETTEFGQVFVQHLQTQSNCEVTIQSQYFRPFKASNDIKRLSNDNIWSIKHIEQTDQIEETHMSAGLIKKQGDQLEFWQERRSFIAVMEEIYKTVRRKNAKQLM